MSDTHHPLFEMLPGLARLCVANGVKLPELVEALKANMVEQAQEIQGKASESSLSLMTGVHRKDVKRLRSQKHHASPQRASLASQVFSTWLSEAPFANKPGKAKTLPRVAQQDASPEASFEALVASVSRDVHHRSVLDELLRLRFVEIDDKDRVKLLAKSFSPPKGEREAMEISAQNIADHMLASASNLHSDSTTCLEQALFSDELSEESAQRFHQISAQAWHACFEQVMPKLQALYKADAQKPKAKRKHRVRLGMYGYSSKQ